jgi:hypothetical protein
MLQEHALQGTPQNVENDYSCVCVRACMHVCVCVCERERERNQESTHHDILDKANTVLKLVGLYGLVIGAVSGDLI